MIMSEEVKSPPEVRLASVLAAAQAIVSCVHAHPQMEDGGKAVCLGCGSTSSFGEPWEPSPLVEKLADAIVAAQGPQPNVASSISGETIEDASAQTTDLLHGPRHLIGQLGDDTFEEVAERFLRLQIEPHLVTSARVASLAALLQSTRPQCTLENFGHMRQLDAIAWTDTPDEWTDAIREAFPTRSGSHDQYAVAMQMVGHRYAKGGLVALVNWLLVRIQQAGGKQTPTSAMSSRAPPKPLPVEPSQDQTTHEEDVKP
jgi:hypothetical protein